MLPANKFCPHAKALPADDQRNRSKDVFHRYVCHAQFVRKILCAQQQLKLNVYDFIFDYYKWNTKLFSVQDDVIHARGMLRDFRKAEDKRQASVFLPLPERRAHPSCMDDAILHGKPFGIIK